MGGRALQRVRVELMSAATDLLVARIHERIAEHERRAAGCTEHAQRMYAEGDVDSGDDDHRDAATYRACAIALQWVLREMRRLGLTETETEERKAS